MRTAAQVPSTTISAIAVLFLSSAGTKIVGQPSMPTNARVSGGQLIDAAPQVPPTMVMTARFDPVTGELAAPPSPAVKDRQATTVFPRWSPDGKAFMYVTIQPTGSLAISVRTIATNAAKEIPVTLTYIWTFDWSRDGRSIVLRASDAQRRSGIFELSLDSGDLRTVAFQVNLQNPNPIGFYHVVYSKTARAITYFKVEGPPPNRHWSYIERDLQSGVERVMHDDLATLMDGAGTYPAGRSPDGLLLMSMTYPGPPSILRAYDTATGKLREVFREDRAEAFNHNGDLRWMPDGRALIGTVGAEDSALWWIPLDNRKPHKIDIGSIKVTPQAIAIHPDGRQIAFVANSTR